MHVQDLKNYGKPLNETAMRPSLGLKLRIVKDALIVLLTNLGPVGALRVMAGTSREGKRMAKVDLSLVREKGCTDEDFIKAITQGAAFFSAIKEVAGLDKAMEINRKIMDRVAVPMNLAVLPPAEDIEKFREGEGAFSAFRQYVKALWEADSKAGIHHFDMVENSDDALAVNVTYCAYCKIPELLGVIDSCESACYSDDVFFPGFLEPLGIRFVRTQSLGRRGELCDFRFERI